LGLLKVRWAARIQIHRFVVSPRLRSATEIKSIERIAYDRSMSTHRGESAARVGPARMAQHSQLALSFVGVAADAHIKNRPRGEREDGRDSRKRKAQARLLTTGLRVLALVLRRIEHREPCSVKNKPDCI
jgi:hypothetical protein